MFAEQNQNNIDLFYDLCSSGKFPILSYYIDAGLLSAMPVGPEDHFIIQRLWNAYYSYEKPEALLHIIQRCSISARNTLEQWYDYKRSVLEVIIQSPSLLHFFPTTKKTEQHYTYLYKQSLPPGHHDDKVMRIKVVLSEIHELMSSPHLAVTLLNEFDQFLKTNWDKEFPTQSVPEYQYELHKTSGLYWPVPVENAPGPTLKKNSFLQRHTIPYLRGNGFGKSCYKFFDAVNVEVFSNVIAHGDFFTENRINPHFLLHGKTIHNLMRIIVIIAWNQGLLSNQNLTLPEVFAAFMDKRFYVDDDPAWTAIADGDIRIVSTFTDPKQFHASLMLACAQSLPTLSALMRHSFCGGIIKIQEYLNKEINQNWSVREVWWNYISPRYLPEVSTHKSSMLTWLKDKGKISAKLEDIQNNAMEVHHLAKL